MYKIDINERKLARQKRVIQRMEAFKFRCYLEAATGFGKTYTAILAKDRIKEIYPDAVVHVVVPRIIIKQSWDRYDGIQVFVVNSYFDKRKEKPDVIISDEVHNYAGKDTKLFKRVVTEHDKFFIGLSATLDKDKKAFLHSHGIKMADRIPIQECLKEGYVSNFRFINLGLHLPPKDKKIYESTEKSIEGITRIFRMAYGFDSITRHMRNLMRNDHNRTNSLEQFTKSEIVNQKTGYPFNTKEVIQLAFALNALYNKRINFLYNHPKKIEVCNKILEISNRKTITFNQRIEVMEELQNTSGVAYHSRMGEKDKKEAMKLFINNDVKVLHTGSSVKEGFDCVDITQGIQLSRTSKRLDLEQFLGRVIRIFEGYTTLFWNVYFKDTQDEKWVKNSTVGIPTIEKYDEKVLYDSDFISNLSS